MHTCRNCGRQFEGNFCPECGTRFEEDPVCPRCGERVAPDEKFCRLCGAPLKGAAPAPTEPTPEVAPATAAVQSGERAQKRYRTLGILPAVLFLLAGIAGFLLCLAPAMTVKDVLFGSGSAAAGSVYEMGSASSKAVIAFCALGTLLSGMGIAFSVIPRIKWLNFPRTRLPLSALFTLLGGAACLGLFAASCAAAADVAAADRNFSNGMGMVGVGAGIILLIVFSILLLLGALGVVLYRRSAAKRDPSLAEHERREREELAVKYTKLELTEAPETVLRDLIRLKRTQIWYMPVLCVAFALLPLNYIRARIFSSIYGGTVLSGLMIALIGSLCMRHVQIDMQRIDNPSRLYRKLHKWFLGVAIAYGILGVSCINFVLVGGNFTLEPYTYSGPFLMYQLGSVPFFTTTSLADIMYQGYCNAGLTIARIVIIYHFAVAIASQRKLNRLKSYCVGAEAPELSVLAAGIEAAPENRHSKRQRILPPICMAAVFLVFMLIPICIFSTNIFTEEKVTSIHYADSQTRVEQVLGKADVKQDGAWYWYSDNYLDLYRRSQSLEQQYESALTQGDMAKLDQLTRELEKLQEEANKTEYCYIVVTFDLENKVSNVTVFNHRQYRDSQTGEYNVVVYELVPSENTGSGMNYFEDYRNIRNFAEFD